jgi:hypothetical protein
MKTPPFSVSLLLSILFPFSFFIISCSDDPVSVPPTITLVRDSITIAEDTTACYGDTLHFLIRAKGGSEKIILLQVKVNDVLVKDTAFSADSLELPWQTQKSADSADRIQFIVRDRKSVQSSVMVKVVLTGSVTWGPVIRYNDITMGAQMNGLKGGFYSLAHNTLYTLQEAFQNQDSIDLLYYYEAGDENTIASPGANLSPTLFAGSFGIANWTVLRTTRFKIATISDEDFNNCLDDSILIASYGTGDGNRKAKNLVQGDYYSFKDADGLTGIFRVKTVVGTDAGIIVIDLISQKK